MNCEEYSREEILNRLLLAFPVTPVLKKKQIIPWMTLPYDDERYALAESLQLRRWTEVPSWYLKQEWAALHLMSRRGYVYFLPAYLRVIVTEKMESDMIPSVVISTLCPATALGRKRIGMLSLEQCKVLLLVVNYINDIMPDENCFGEVDCIIEFLHNKVCCKE